MPEVQKKESLRIKRKFRDVRQMRAVRTGEN